MGGAGTILPCLQMLSATASKNPTQRHTRLMHMDLHCSVIYGNKVGNKPNAGCSLPVE